MIALIGKFEKIWDEEGKALSFEKLGYKVKRYSEDNFTMEKAIEIIQEKPELVIWAKLKIHAPIAQYLVETCKQAGIKTVCWHPDLFIGLGREYRIGMDPMFKADYVFSPDGGNQDKFRKYGVNHEVIRQGCYHGDCYISDKKPKHDIVFIGTDNPNWTYRYELMSFLQNTYGNRFKWIGRGDSDAVRGKDLNDLISETKIIIGDSVASKSYWSNRIYETTARGGFIIHPFTEGIDKEYTPYEHFIPYNYGDFKGLKEKIDYYLAHDKERDEIRLKGFEHTKNNLTLLNKCKELLCITGVIAQKK